MLAQCLEPQLNFLGGKTWSRTNVGLIITCCDIICLIIFVIATIYQQEMTRVTVEEFRDQHLETKDFALEINGLPGRGVYKNEKILKGMLWMHLRKLLQSETQRIREMATFQRYQDEIVDVFFGYKHYDKYEYLALMAEKHKKKKIAISLKE